jgi:hypothetical protein
MNIVELTPDAKKTGDLYRLIEKKLYKEALKRAEVHIMKLLPCFCEPASTDELDESFFGYTYALYTAGYCHNKLRNYSEALNHFMNLKKTFNESGCTPEFLNEYLIDIRNRIVDVQSTAIQKNTKQRGLK